ncbi:MAG: hypothetical protein AAB333_01385 [Pseudomonadota bacterium]
MNVRNRGTGVNSSLTAPTLTARTAVWPSRSYARQVATLQRRIGQPIYIVELTFNGLAVGAIFHGEPRVLLDVVAFPRPDPSNHLYPHLLVLDDGRGINLGRIARVTANRAFAPDKTDVLYGNRALQHHFLYRAQRLTPRHIARVARQQLRTLLGRPMDKRLGQARGTP